MLNVSKFTKKFIKMFHLVLDLLDRWQALDQQRKFNVKAKTILFKQMKSKS